MPMLPYLATNFLAIAGERIEFLSRFAELSLAQKFGQLDERQAPLAAANALTEAASLAFAAAQTRQGCDLSNLALNALDRLPSDVPLPLRRAVLSSLLGRSTVALRSEGIIIDDLPRDGGRSRTLDWPDATTLAEIGGGLLAATFANPPPNFDPSLRDLQAAPLTVRALALAPEAGARLAFAVGRQVDEEARAAFGALHQRYAAQILLLAPNEPGWEVRLLRAELIDWSLLSLHVGLHRMQISTEHYLLQGDGRVAIFGRYIDELARELVALTRSAPPGEFTPPL